MIKKFNIMPTGICKLGRFQYELRYKKTITKEAVLYDGVILTVTPLVFSMKEQSNGKKVFSPTSLLEYERLVISKTINRLEGRITSLY